MLPDKLLRISLLDPVGASSYSAQGQPTSSSRWGPEGLWGSTGYAGIDTGCLDEAGQGTHPVGCDILSRVCEPKKENFVITKVFMHREVLDYGVRGLRHKQALESLVMVVFITQIPTDSKSGSGFMTTR